VVFPEGDISDIVQTIFNRPVPPFQLRQPSESGQGGRQIREEVDDLLGNRAGASLCNGAGELVDLLNKREARMQVIIQRG
jgi:hypothetical protein